MRFTLEIYTDNNDLRELYQNVENYNDDSGRDVYCPSNLDIKYDGTENLNYKITKVDLDIVAKMYDNKKQKYVGFYLEERSSTCKYGISLANKRGIIDAGYNGHLIAGVLLYRCESYTAISQLGNRFFQITNAKLEPMERYLGDKKYLIGD